MDLSPARFPARPSLAAPTALGAAVLLAWLPMLGPALRVADDFAYLRLSAGGLGAYFREAGFWRPLGQHFPALLWHLNPALPAATILLSHVIATVLLFRAAQSVLGGGRLPFLLALVFGTFPFGYEALLWLIASNYAFATTLFLANLVLLGTARARPASIILSASLALATALCNECWLLATMAAGALALPRSRALAQAPAAGAGLWLLLIYVGGNHSGRPVTFNPDVILSTYWHQYSLLDIFQPWGSAFCRSLLFTGWTPWLGLAGLACALVTVLSARALPSGAPALATGWFTPAVLVAMMLGLSAVFALGGGYSLDARKKYAVLPLLLLAFGWCWRRAGLRFPPKLQPAFLLAVASVGVATTWLVIGIWKHEVPVYARLADELAAHQITSVAVVRQPDIHAEWPTFARSLGFRLDDSWVLSLALHSRGADSVQVSPTAPVTATFDPARGRWHLQPAPPR